MPFSLAIPRNQRVGPDGEKPGTYYHKYRFYFHKIPLLTPIDGSDTMTLTRTNHGQLGVLSCLPLLRLVTYNIYDRISGRRSC